MWYGDVAKIPDDWHICDGTENTPDLRNRFVYGAGGEEHTVGETGGEEEVILTVEQMPQHGHGLLMYNPSSSASGGLSSVCLNVQFAGYQHFNNNDGPVSGVSGKTTDTPLSIMPPYMVLYYIMKIK